MQFFRLILFHYFYIGYCSDLFGLNLYHTDRLLNDLYRDCLYYNSPDKGLVSQLIEYCIRFHFDEELINTTNYHQSFTFEELRKSNVTSSQLYTWLAPIDLIEHYQIYLENISYANTLLYYNCTYPWFGSYCEYTFDYPQSSFAKQVEMNFFAKYIPMEGLPLQHLPCYIHLKCDRVSDYGKTEGACLDWREICDGKVDCIDGGHDEEQCWQLEINECDKETEFRCHIGLCIPLNFLNDDEKNADCLDRTDEPYTGHSSSWGYEYRDSACHMDPASRCEDHMYRSITNSEYTLECGDSIRTNPFMYNCPNMRNIVLMNALFTQMNVSDVCRLAFYCVIRSSIMFVYDYPMLYNCDDTKYNLYAVLIQQHCPSLIALPPILFGHVRFVYTNDQFIVSKLFLNICAF